MWDWATHRLGLFNLWVPMTDRLVKVKADPGVHGSEVHMDLGQTLGWLSVPVASISNSKNCTCPRSVLMLWGTAYLCVL